MATPRGNEKSENYGSPNQTVPMYYWRQNGYNAGPGERTWVLQYTMQQCLATPKKRTAYGYPYAISARDTEGSSLIFAGDVGTENRAYAKFREKALGDASSLGVAAAEWKESLGMINKRALALYHAYRDIRKGNFADALRSLSVDPKRKHKSKKRAAAHETSALWLEYWFGWSPFLSDIYNAEESLCDNLPSQRFSAGAATTLQKSIGSSGSYYQTHKVRFRANTGATIGINNPNLFLMSQLGIVNPLTIAWELVPFSFLVDWVSKTGNFLESFSDFVGCSVVHPYRNRVGSFYSSYSEPTGGETFLAGAAMSRQTGLIRPLPSWNADSKTSTFLTRAATSVSLLTQLLGGSRSQ